MKRVTSLLLALMLIVSLAACGPAGEEGQQADNNTQQVNAVRELLDMDPDTVLLTVDGNELPVGIYVYQFLYTCDYLAQYYGSICMDEEGNFLWDTMLGEDTTVMDFLKEATDGNALSYAIVENLAKEDGVEITEEELAELDDSLNSQVESLGSREAFEDELGLTGLTWDQNYRLAKSYYYYLGLLEQCVTEGSPLYITDEKLYSYEGITEDSIMADHILLTTGDDEEENQKLYEVMEQMKTILADAEDPVAAFSVLADSYSQDPGRSYYPDGYVFGRGEMVAPFEEAAYALEEYEISDIVESEHGYHLILRKPLRDYVKEQYLQEVLQETRETADIQWNQEVLDKIDMKQLFADYTAWRNQLNEEESGETDGETAGDTGETAGETGETDNSSSSDTENDAGEEGAE